MDLAVTALNRRKNTAGAVELLESCTLKLKGTVKGASVKEERNGNGPAGQIELALNLGVFED